MITSYYLCDDVIVCHALPNFVQGIVHWGKRERIRQGVYTFFVAGDAAAAMHIIHGNNHSQASTFDREIEKWVARSYFGNSSSIKALLKLALSSFRAFFYSSVGFASTTRPDWLKNSRHFFIQSEVN